MALKYFFISERVNHVQLYRREVLFYQIIGAGYTLASLPMFPDEIFCGEQCRVPDYIGLFSWISMELRKISIKHERSGLSSYNGAIGLLQAPNNWTRGRSIQKLTANRRTEVTI